MACLKFFGKYPVETNIPKSSTGRGFCEWEIFFHIFNAFLSCYIFHLFVSIFVCCYWSDKVGCITVHCCSLLYLELSVYVHIRVVFMYLINLLVLLQCDWEGFPPVNCVILLILQLCSHFVNSRDGDLVLSTPSMFLFIFPAALWYMDIGVLGIWIVYVLIIPLWEGGCSWRLNLVLGVRLDDHIYCFLHGLEMMCWCLFCILESLALMIPFSRWFNRLQYSRLRCLRFCSRFVVS